MKLVDLKPRWLDYNGQDIAIMFLCPHCAGKGPDTWLTCFFHAPSTIARIANDDPLEGLRGSRGERRLFYDALREMGHPDPLEGAYHDVVNCRATCAWTRTSDDLATMSITPSIDASAAGHWHGFITAGEIL